MTAGSVTHQMRSLLSLAGTQRRYADAIAEATGEHFNVFRILGVHHREVTTHSPMLAALLNPKGTHGQGSVFLELFLARFQIHKFDPRTAVVRVEHHMGTVKENSGGRIDILLRDGNGAAILIENKIYAGDQPDQMTRNRNFDPGAELFYLTLDAREPAGNAAVEGLRCISYASDILLWLKACRKEAACVPNVRETLSQYIHLVEELTRQNTSARMDQELTNAILQSKDSYLAFTTLCRARHEVRRTILTGLNNSLRVAATDMGLELAQPLFMDGRKSDGWFFSSTELASQNLRIGFQFDAKNYQQGYFGFNLINPKEGSPFATRLRDLFSAAFGHMPKTEGYVVHNWCQQYRFWSDEVFESILFGPFISDLKVLTGRLLEIFDQACSISPATSPAELS